MGDFIVFPESASWEIARGLISFPAEVDGRRIKCSVTTDTLQRLGAPRTQEILENPVAQFQFIQVRARETAKRLLAKGRGIATGQLLLKPEDFA